MWIKHVIRVLLAVLVISASLISARWVMTTPESNSTDKTIALHTSGQQPVQQQLRILLVQEDGDSRRILICREGVCRVQPEPASIESRPVSDGLSWYHYVEQTQDRRRQTKKVLQRTWFDNQKVTVIVEQTPLVRPRDLVISPNGQRVAYWLDNVNDKKNDLTEIWVYDAKEGSTRLVAEKIDRQTVQSRLRWNRASSHLWFVSDKANNREEAAAPHFQLLQVQPVQTASPFSQLEWGSFLPQANYGVVDVSYSGQSLAYVTGEGVPRLVITTQNGSVQQRTVAGGVPFLQWLEDDSLLYAVQEKTGLSVWRVLGSVHRQLAHQPGVLLSAQIDEQANYMVMIIRQKKHQDQILVMDMNNGVVAGSADVPKFGQITHVVQVINEASQITGLTAVSTVLNDEQLVAFVEGHMADIAGTPLAKPKTMVMTEDINTLYVHFQNSAGQEERILLTVRDAIHPEWSIRNRSIRQQGEWRAVGRPAEIEPKPARLYEWETSLQRWILKTDYSQSPG